MSSFVGNMLLHDMSFYTFSVGGGECLADVAMACNLGLRFPEKCGIMKIDFYLKLGGLLR